MRVRVRVKVWVRVRVRVRFERVKEHNSPQRKTRDHETSLPNEAHNNTRHDRRIIMAKRC